MPGVIQSVLDQTLQPSEIIVIDDGSTDHTASIIKSFAEVQYIYQKNKGVSHARNNGIDIAQYEWIAFLDSDDLWLPNKLERQFEALTKQKHIQFCHTDEIWIRNGKRVNPMKKHMKHGGFIFPHCLPLCVISPSSVLVHRTIFKTYGKFDVNLPVCEDYDLWLRICAREPVLLVDEHLVLKNGGHADQLSQAFWGMDRFRIYALEKLINSNVLDEVSLGKTVITLCDKIDIYVNGASKRGKTDEAQTYKNKKKYYKSHFPEVFGS